MHKIFSLLALIIFSGSFLYSQNILSQDYNTPNIINVDTECNFTEWHLENGVSSEIGIPICNRNYVDNNYYFQFQIPPSGNAKLSVEFSEQVEFGLATYYYNQGTLEELKCDVFSSEDGFITIAENQDLALIDIIVQLWIITPNIASVDICVYEIESLEPEVKLAVFPDMFTPQQLVEDTLVTGCLEAYNVTYNGSNQSIGYFNQGLPGLDFATGIVLSTGDVADAPGPNTSGSTSTGTSSGSDPHLQALVPGYTVNDATVLEFDFVPASDVLQFEYVFGSEEYPEFVNSSFNDVFGFFLTG
ncbi:MAG TPA: choice-of-anchor L domain-containing protein, partial [Bacteroidales bacterium]|nr:choice-of-anchor L domain-containing protein [Bacteroidales bacterium]